MTTPMTREEREQYEALMERACFDEYGKAYPTRELGERVAYELEHAQATGSGWANAMARDDQESGHQRRAKQWLKAKQLITFPSGEQVVATRTQSYSVRNSGGIFQPTLIADMTAEQVAEFHAMTRSQVDALSGNLKLARALLDLLDAYPAAETVRDALRLAGSTLEEWLAA